MQALNRGVAQNYHGRHDARMTAPKTTRARPIAIRPMMAGGEIIPQAALDAARLLIGRANQAFATVGVANVLIGYGVTPFAAGYAAERITQQERKAGRIRWSAKDRGWLVARPVAVTAEVSA